MPLKCESTLSPDELPRMPLFPGKRQKWLIVLRARPDITEDEREEMVRGLFQRWLPLFPGPIGEPEVLDLDDTPASSIVQPPKLGFRGPSDTVGVAFDYMGTETEMRWPTFVARRRERIEALCPMAPTDSMPIAVVEPEDDAEGDEALEPRPNPNAPDPFDLGIGPIDPTKFKLALGGSALLVGVGAGLVLLLALRRTKG